MGKNSYLGGSTLVTGGKVRFSEEDVAQNRKPAKADVAMERKRRKKAARKSRELEKRRIALQQANAAREQKLLDGRQSGKVYSHEPIRAVVVHRSKKSINKPT